jgi:hypothetical protein
MSTAFSATLEVPAEIEEAAQSGELVVFVGAGISRLINCPSWDGFANKVLRQLLVPSGINHYDLSQINSIPDPKKRLSIAKIVAETKGIKIDYAKIFKVDPEPVNVYTHLNQFNSSFVTTNYEKFIVPESRKTELEGTWRFFRRNQLLRANLDANGNVIHLHGCTDDSSTMIITTKDYLEHYGTAEVQEFLKYLFEKKTVLFLGYGLEEVEILEYILKRGGAVTKPGPTRVRRYILQGFFNAEQTLYSLLSAFYRDSFDCELIPFPKDHKNHLHQVDILAAWAMKLRFGKSALTDHVAALEEEIRG